MHEADILTWLTDSAEPPPALGEAVALRTGRTRTEVLAYSAAGRRLGRLPPEEGAAVAELLASHGGSLPARIAALVPRPATPGGSRIHLWVSAD